MLIEILVICALTQTSPFYDCSSHWEIQIYDTDFISDECGYIGKNHKITGCAIYSNGTEDKYSVKPVIKVGTWKGKDIWGMSSLEHELKHVKCKCVWAGHNNI